MDICIVGTGYVGLVTAACFAEMGNTVRCIDKREDIIENLNNGKVHIYEPGLDLLVERNIKEGRLAFSMDLEKAIEDVLFIFNCVGTPSSPDGSCDLTAVEEVANQIGQLISEYKIIVNKSTVPVGTADKVSEVIQKGIDARGLNIEFDVVSNPEFLKEGDAVNDFLKPDRVIVGTDNVRTAKLLETLYSPFARSRSKLIVMGVKSAEMTKYAANCMLATKISFMNEISNICENIGADVEEVRKGIGADHRIGFHFIYPGLGFGGSCFPKDVRALIHAANQNQVVPNLIQAVDQVNNMQKRLIAEKVSLFFKDKGGLEGKTLALWGLSFKPNTDDIREAPALEIIRRLTQKGMKIRCYDPVAGENAVAALKNNDLVEIVQDQYAALESADSLVIATEWNQFRNPDFPRMKKAMRAPVVFDGRNLYKPEQMADEGFVYFSIGRPVIGEK